MKKKSRSRKKQSTKKNQKECPVDYEGSTADGANQDEIWLRDHYDSNGDPCFK